MAKLGDTDYTLGNVDDRLSERFIPASALTAARRDVLALIPGIPKPDNAHAAARAVEIEPVKA